MKYLITNNERTTEEQYWSYCEKEHNPFIISFLVRKQDLDFVASNLFDWLIFEKCRKK